MQIRNFAIVLKKVFAIFLIVLISLQPICKLWIYASFKINQDSIAKTLCVKKEIKNNGCQGKCQLMKKLKQADNAEQKQFPEYLTERLELIFCQTPIFSITHTPIVFTEVKQSFANYNVDYISSFFLNIFRPPKFS